MILKIKVKVTTCIYNNVRIRDKDSTNSGKANMHSWVITGLGNRYRQTRERVDSKPQQ